MSSHTAIGPSGTQFPLGYSGGVGLGGPWGLCGMNVVVCWAVILTLTGPVSVTSAGVDVQVQGGVGPELL